ncbi:MAG: hypothetical protein KGI55_02395 [Gammaproteobacteria bacterium]|nr:hypothetical protein [Gammaproteobacteria bacterium]
MTNRSPITEQTAARAPYRRAASGPGGGESPGTAPVAVFDNTWSVTTCSMASLGRRGVPLHVYGQGFGRWSRYCTRRLPCPPVDDADRFLVWLEGRIRAGEIGRVAPTTDLIAYYTSLLRDVFPPEVRRTIAPIDEIENCLIKTRFAEKCRRIGQPVPAAVVTDSVAEALAAGDSLGYPLIMKPQAHLGTGAAERGLLVEDREMLRRVFQPYSLVAGHAAIVSRHPELRWPLLQRYIPSARTRVYSVSGFKDADGGIIVASLSCKRHQWPPNVGVSTWQVTCHDPRILAAGLAVVNGLISCGIFEVELLEDGHELLAIDLNPRAFGFLPLDMAIGNDLPWLWYQATHQALRPRTGAAPAWGAAARGGAPYWLARLVGAIDEEAEPSPRRIVSMLGYWNDPLPMVLNQLSLLRNPRSLFRPYIRRAASRSRVGT